MGNDAKGCILALTEKPLDAIEAIASGITAMQSTGTSMWMPVWLSHLAAAKGQVGEFEDATRFITEAAIAMEATNERWYEAEVSRIAGEIALLSSEPNPSKAEASFTRALAVARQQQARSWELRAATSMARLWRDQEKRESARELLTPVHGWFTQGFDTFDLVQAKALLDDLA
jgi:predicted ATPase